jgi:hypothetical protein
MLEKLRDGSTLLRFEPLSYNLAFIRSLKEMMQRSWLRFSFTTR